MPTAEDHLRTDAGALIMQLLIQVATLRAELDRLRDRSPAPPAPVASPNEVP